MNTMFEKCAVAGDITKAIDRRGCWSVAIVVIGGTESTAVKLQSCETADGSFTDYKELIPASEASADQYKGFVLDLYGAGKFIKVVGATMATAVLGDCEADVKKIAITAGEIPSGADLEDNKSATINVSTYTEPVEIEPTAGKDGMKKATVTLSNIPSNKMYAWQSDKAVAIEYFPFSSSPSSYADVKIKGNVHAWWSETDNRLYITRFLGSDDDYDKISDTSFSQTYEEDDENVTETYTRVSSKDITLWRN